MSSAALSHLLALSVLGVERGATPADVRAAYKRQCLVHHPDRPTGSTDAFKRIHAAYLALSATGHTSGGTGGRGGKAAASRGGGAAASPTAATSAGGGTEPSSSCRSRGFAATSSKTHVKGHGHLDAGGDTPSAKPVRRASQRFVCGSYCAPLLCPLREVEEALHFSVLMPGTGDRVRQRYAFEVAAAAFAACGLPLRSGALICVGGRAGVVLGLASDGVYWAPGAQTTAAAAKLALSAVRLGHPTLLRCVGAAAAATSLLSSSAGVCATRGVARPSTAGPEAAAGDAADAAATPVVVVVVVGIVRQPMGPRQMCGAAATRGDSRGSSAGASLSGSSSLASTTSSTSTAAPPTEGEEAEEDPAVRQGGGGLGAKGAQLSPPPPPLPSRPPTSAVEQLVREEALCRTAVMQAVDEWILRAWWAARLPLYAPTDRRYNAKNS